MAELGRGGCWIVASPMRVEKNTTDRGIDLLRTLGLLLAAKRLGLSSAVRPVIERLRTTGAWYDEPLLERVLAAAGEG